MNKFSAGSCLVILFFICAGIRLLSSCAQIAMPTGGPRDTIPPVLVRSYPLNKSTNFAGNKITLHFNEYITLQDVSNNILISPYQRNQPLISFDLKTVTVKFRDSLLPNTTYTINFGNAVKDLNENNPYRNFRFVFSTGNYLDSMQLIGKVLLAESGKVDSTLSVLLYRDLTDSAVKKKRPDFMTKLKGDGSFQFENLPAARFNIFALKDGDNSRTYNAPTETFAFADSVVNPALSAPPITLFAFEEKKTETVKTKLLKPAFDKKLSLSTSIQGNKHDLREPLELTFSNPLLQVPDSAIVLTDTLFQALKNQSLDIDSTRRKITLFRQWTPGAIYKILIRPGSIKDSSGLIYKRNDTLTFAANPLSAYGTLLLRFDTYDTSKHLLIQLLLMDKIVVSEKLYGKEWKHNLLLPGDYDIRIVEDANDNGEWSPGNYNKRQQPEKAFTLPQKLNIRADWDNERDIQL